MEDTEWEVLLQWREGSEDMAVDRDMLLPLVSEEVMADVEEAFLLNSQGDRSMLQTDDVDFVE
jgi:hypothetical protein